MLNLDHRILLMKSTNVADWSVRTRTVNNVSGLLAINHTTKKLKNDKTVIF